MTSRRVTGRHLTGALKLTGGSRRRESAEQLRRCELLVLEGPAPLAR
jgi:hypothetical protein